MLVCTRRSEINYSFSALELLNKTINRTPIKLEFLNKTDVILISGAAPLLSTVMVMRKYKLHCEGETAEQVCN